MIGQRRWVRGPMVSCMVDGAGLLAWFTGLLIVFTFVLYYVIRAAVRGGIDDAEAARRRRRRGPSGPGA